MIFNVPNEEEIKEVKEEVNELTGQLTKMFTTKTYSQTNYNISAGITGQSVLQKNIVVDGYTPVAITQRRVGNGNLKFWYENLTSTNVDIRFNNTSNTTIASDTLTATILYIKNEFV